MIFIVTLAIISLAGASDNVFERSIEDLYEKLVTFQEDDIEELAQPSK